MKIALLSGFPNGAIDQVMQAIQKATAPLGIETDILGVYKPEFKDTDLNNYDIAHAGFYPYFMMTPPENLPAGMTANVWHISFAPGGGLLPDLVRNGHEINRFIVDDVMTLQQLGLVGFTDVTKIPLPVDPSKWHHLPAPKSEFTVGIFCNDYPYKRWEVVVQAAKQAKVKCLAFVMPEGRKDYDLDPLNDIYAKVHVLASATFVDTNSLPLREALMCGRPVVSTQNDGMSRVLVDGVNGYWFDGSTKDLAEKLTYCKENYERLAAGARNTTMESLEYIGQAYKKVWEGVLSE